MNQSVNVMCNYVNRSGASVDTSQIAQAYGLAVGVSCSIAVGARKLVEAGPPWVKRLGIAVPYAAVVAAGSANVAFTRMPEMQDGVPISAPDGTNLGVSKLAAQSAVINVRSLCQLACRGGTAGRGHEVPRADLTERGWHARAPPRACVGGARRCSRVTCCCRSRQCYCRRCSTRPCALCCLSAPSPPPSPRQLSLLARSTARCRSPSPSSRRCVRTRGRCRETQISVLRTCLSRPLAPWPWQEMKISASALEPEFQEVLAKKKIDYVLCNKGL